MEFKVLNQKIAIPTANGVLFPHFGRAPELTIVTVIAGMVTDTEVLKAPEHEHGVLPRFITKNEISALLFSDKVRKQRSSEVSDVHISRW